MLSQSEDITVDPGDGSNWDLHAPLDILEIRAFGERNTSLAQIEEFGLPPAYGPLPAKLSPELQVFKDILTNLDFYVVPLIILVGMIGNTLSFVVFLATHLKRNSCNIYLASLAMADNAFLFCVFLSWSYKIGVSIYNQAGWCQLLVYLTHVSSFLSVWYVVAFTLERFIVVCFPLRRHQLCTTKIAKLMVGSLAAISLVAYGFAIFTTGVIDFNGTPLCVPLPEYFRVVATINNIDTLITLIIPTIIIIGCNIRITRVVWSFYKTNRDQVAATPMQKWDFSHHTNSSGVDLGAASGHHHTSSRQKTHMYTMYNRGNLRQATSCNNTATTAAASTVDKNSVNPVPRTSHMRATRMLLIVSTVFLVCNLPSHAARTYAFIMTLIDEDYKLAPAFLLTQQLFHIIYYMNFAVNFFLYSFSGCSFRIGLKRLKTKLKRKWRDLCYLVRRTRSPTSSPRFLSAKTEMHIQSLH